MKRRLVLKYPVVCLILSICMDIMSGRVIVAHVQKQYYTSALFWAVVCFIFFSVLAIIAIRNIREKPAAVPAYRRNPFPQEYTDDTAYVFTCSHTSLTAPWHRYDITINARQYGWEAMVDWADYMVTNELSNVSQVMTGMGQTDVTEAFNNNNRRCKGLAELEEEGLFLCIAGVSKTIGLPMTILWANQSRSLHLFTIIEDMDMATRYAETAIRRTFGTENAMKLGKPKNAETTSSQAAASEQAAPAKPAAAPAKPAAAPATPADITSIPRTGRMRILSFTFGTYTLPYIFDDGSIHLFTSDDASCGTLPMCFLFVSLKPFYDVDCQLLGIEKVVIDPYKNSREATLPEILGERPQLYGAHLNALIIRHHQFNLCVKNPTEEDQEKHRALLREMYQEISKTLFLVPIIYDGESETAPVQDNILHLSPGAMHSGLSLAVEHFLFWDDPIRYRYATESDTLPQGQMHARTVENGTQIFVPVFTDFATLHGTFKDGCHVAVMTFEEIEALAETPAAAEEIPISDIAFNPHLINMLENNGPIVGRSISGIVINPHLTNMVLENDGPIVRIMKTGSDSAPDIVSELSSGRS